MPEEEPTPPKGKLGLAKCINVSLIAPPQMIILQSTLCVMFSSSLKRYKLNGFDLLWMISSTSSKLS